MVEWIEAGAQAADFSLPADDGTTVHLASLRGRPVVLYFYPEDDTPACTRQACIMRDRKSDIEAAGAVLLGVSPNDVASHRAFRDKYDLNFTLLADVDHLVADAYGAWREKVLYGRRYLGLQRSTFLIDATGVVAKVWKRVIINHHDDKVLEALAALSRAGPTSGSGRLPR